MRLDVVTIFPDYLRALDLSLIGRAVADGTLTLGVHDLRDWTRDRHRTVDDTPLGGGAGMVMKPDVWGRALDDVLALSTPAAAPVPDQDDHRDVRDDDCHHRDDDHEIGHRDDDRSDDHDDVAGAAQADPGPRRRVLVIPTPSGATFTQRTAEDLAGADQVVFACGRYEGIDARVAAHYAARATDPVEVRELSIGDYVLNGGEVAALVMIEAVARLLPGVLGNAESLVEESHGAAGLLEYPVHTRPTAWRGLEVEPVLLSGDHGRIARHRRDQALERTALRRPDMIAALDTGQLDPADRATLARLGWAAPVGVEHPVPLVVRAADHGDVPGLVTLARATFPDACPPFLSREHIEAHMDANLGPDRFTEWIDDPRAVVLLAEVPAPDPADHRAPAPTSPAGYAVVLVDLPGADGTGPAGLDPTPAAVAARAVPEQQAEQGGSDEVLAELSKVYVDASLRGAGVAAALVEAAARAAGRLGVNRLWLGTHKDNKRAQKAYKRTGFATVGRRSYDVGGQRCTDVVMARALGGC